MTVTGSSARVRERERHMISGKTTLIAHVGYPTFAFKAPMIYNPWFEANGVDAIVMPMGVKPEDYPEFFRMLFRLTNIRGALVTMPHKVTTMELVDEVTPIAAVAGATNAVLLREDGSLLADQFDGAGFVRGVLRKGFSLEGKRGLVVGNGGVGSPIAASLAGEGVAASGPVRPEQRGLGVAGEAPERTLPGARGDHRLEGPGRATTSSSTRPRSE